MTRQRVVRTAAYFHAGADSAPLVKYVRIVLEASARRSVEKGRRQRGRDRAGGGLALAGGWDLCAAGCDWAGGRREKRASKA